MCCSQLHRKGEEHDNAFSLKIVCHPKLLAIHVGILQRLSISSDCYTVDGDEYFATRALSIYLCLEQGCMSLLDIFCILWRGAVHGFFLQKRFDVGFEDDPILNEPLEKETVTSCNEKRPENEIMDLELAFCWLVCICIAALRSTHIGNGFALRVSQPLRLPIFAELCHSCHAG